MLVALAHEHIQQEVGVHGLHGGLPALVPCTGTSFPVAASLSIEVMWGSAGHGLVRASAQPN
eukprot:354946-Chlamydomonas_euryale.AAC.8